MERLISLADALRLSPGHQEKLEHLDRDLMVAAYLRDPSALRTFLAGLPLECELIIKSLIAIGQAERLFPHQEEMEGGFTDQMRALLEDLLPVERFYREIGGLVGYHTLLLTQIQKKEAPISETRCIYHRPQGLELFDLTDDVKRYILEGIRHLPFVAEIYPVGGAADRLRLQDPHTKIPLPAARLQFCGKTLLEWMVQDVQAREYVYFKLFKEQITVPIAMMTSQEKGNHGQILSLCEEKKWFGRSAGSFAFFCQPAVPTMDREGNWCLSRLQNSDTGALQPAHLLKPLRPLMKPGGHGVIWKLAKDQGIFRWLSDLGEKESDCASD